MMLNIADMTLNAIKQRTSWIQCTSKKMSSKKSCHKWKDTSLNVGLSVFPMNSHDSLLMTDTTDAREIIVICYPPSLVRTRVNNKCLRLVWRLANLGETHKFTKLMRYSDQIKIHKLNQIQHSTGGIILVKTESEQNKISSKYEISSSEIMHTWCYQVLPCACE